jgi:hypothetical protein
MPLAIHSGPSKQSLCSAADENEVWTVPSEQSVTTSCEQEIVRIEQHARLVVLARTLDTKSADATETLERTATEWRQFGDTCLGRALYRHSSIFKSQSAAPVWSHAEFVYFRDIVPCDVIDQLVRTPQPFGMHLLRAEILVTTPQSFVFPQGWTGSAHRPDRKPSLEYLDVDPSCLQDYREIMRRYIGPAASKLVAMGKLGTFRTMETVAVLFQAPSLGASWNQIHLSEVDATGFQGFGQELDAAVREIFPDGGFAAVFAGLDQMRTIPRWTLNEAVVEADAGIGQWSLARATR